MVVVAGGLWVVVVWWLVQLGGLVVVFCFLVLWCFNIDGGDGWLLAVGLSFSSRWLLVVVVIAGCVGLRERERNRVGREEREVREVSFFFLEKQDWKPPA